MTRKRKRDVERRLDDLEGDMDGDGGDGDDGLRIVMNQRNADGELVEREETVLSHSGNVIETSHNDIEENSY